MCSIGEDDFGDDGGAHAMIKELNLEPAEILKGICKKCNQNEVVVKLNYREAECRNCFLEYVRHKFRATLGSSKILPKEAEVLVIFDGSPESIVLLDMIYFAITQNNFKRLRCNPKCLYIDQQFLNNNGASNVLLGEVKEIVLNYNIQSYLMSISSDKDPIKLDDNIPEDGSLFKIDETIFKNHFDKIKTLTSRQDFITKIRYNKIKSAAECLGCTYVFLPDIAPSLATTLLNDIILGRGGSAALDVSLLDDRIPNLKLIRPIKDLSQKEIQNYVQICNLKYLERSVTFGEQNGPHSSLQNLTKAFVDNLQQNFPSTVSTVFRTGDKLAPKKFRKPNNRISNGDIDHNSADPMEDLSCCSFCYSNLDYFDAKTLFATEFSRLVSQCASENSSDLESLEEKAKMQLEQSNSTVISKLCHGCRNIYYECPDYFNS